MDNMFDFQEDFGTEEEIDQEDRGLDFLMLCKKKLKVTDGTFVTYQTRLIVNADGEDEALAIFKNFFNDMTGLIPQRKDMIIINLMEIPYIGGRYENEGEENSGSTD